MEKKLIPFYREAYRNRMGYTLFIDMNTMGIYRVYDDNYRFFQSSQYWFYFLGGYWILKGIGDFNIHMNFLPSVLILLVIGGGFFWYGYHHLYKKAMENMNLKNTYLTKDEFIGYAKTGRQNARLLIIVLMVIIIIYLFLLKFYLAVPAIDLLIIISLLSFVIGGIIRSLPIQRLRLNYQNSFLEKVATEVHNKMAQ
ncbi:hypothetical protein F3157_16655 [Virgibacillus dakarensis]|uniref:Uncharacterized protein n=1 Tax=Lentibacillus populi TaxID=1827502 RepID=A0A9W5TVA2_9BACI|nr:hypothetical protein [Lentibacillus populi]MTW87270.1 hypothetical protein [Virgibacillus dakarensis]GGB34724.1 hypothetical protein GCM10011409_10210 [Lentibacillus populi]